MVCSPLTDLVRLTAPWPLLSIMMIVVVAAVLNRSDFAVPSDSYSVEKSPSIKVHRVTDPPLKKNIRSALVRLLVKWSFVSFEVEKMRMFLVQSMVRWCRWVLMRSWGAVVSFPV